MRILYLLLVLVTICNDAFAQNAGEFGFKGGLNVSTLGNKESGSSSKLGYHIGFVGEKRYFQELGVKAELMVSFQGARSNQVSELKLNYSYLTLPIVAAIYISEGTSLDLGLQGGYLFRAVQKDGGYKINIRDSVNNWDLSGIFGLSYGKPYGRVGIRYLLGISNTNGTFFTFDTNSKNRVFQAYISIPLIIYE